MSSMEHSASQPPLPADHPPQPPPPDDEATPTPPLPPSPSAQEDSTRHFPSIGGRTHRNENSRDPLLGGNCSYISTLDGVLGEDEEMSHDDSNLEAICAIIKPLGHDVDDGLVGFDKAIVNEVEYTEDVDSPFTTNSSQENTLDSRILLEDDTNSEASSCPFSLAPASDQMTIRGTKRMDFMVDDGGIDDLQSEEGQPPPKQAKFEGIGLDNDMEDEENIEENVERNEENIEKASEKDTEEPDKAQAQGGVEGNKENEKTVSEKGSGTAKKGSKKQNALNKDFQVIDDIGSDQEEADEMVGGSESEDEWVQAEPGEADIDAMLDAPVKDYKEKHMKDGREPPEEKEKVILVDKYQDPFDIMPEGWIQVTHNSGMPLYLHKDTRVLTLSKPYFIGPTSVRRHEVPLSAIPCLAYVRAMEREKEKEKNIKAAHGKDAGRIFEELNKLGEFLNSECPNGEGKEKAATDKNIAAASGDKNTQQATKDGETSGDKNGAESEKAKETSQDKTSENNAPNTKGNEVTDDLKENIRTKALAAGVTIATAEEYHKERMITPEELLEYCRKRFQFKTIIVRRFRSWRDRRRHAYKVNRKQNVKQTGMANSTTKLIKCPSALEKNMKLNYHESKRIREVILNPTGKSDVCLLHEYVQHALRIQPKFQFAEIQNAQTPYSATVEIDSTKYGTGYGSSKKIAKSEASRITLEILLPEILKVRGKEKDFSLEEQDVSFFDDIKIDDPRVTDLCKKAGQAGPFAILEECVKRNFGLKDLSIEMDMKVTKHQKSEFTMKVGKHEACITCKNKREGKQRAAQVILNKMHPHVHCWGSLLRLYGNQRAFKEKKAEEQSITSLQTQAVQPNKAILSKLKVEMMKLHDKRENMEIRMKGKFEVETSGFKFTEPNMVDA